MISGNLSKPEICSTQTEILMTSKNPDVNVFFTSGCGRCSLWDTPQCKVHSWTAELALLRNIVLDCGLTEELKWGVPCYTFRKKNVVMISALKDSAVISFLKGALIKDVKGILKKPGENSQIARVIKFKSAREIDKVSSLLKAYIFEAIEIEKEGLKVVTGKNPGPIPEEFIQKMEEFPALKTAFHKLTPGRQRGYIIYFSAPKQSKTRETRIEKYIPKILNGKGFHDR